MNINLFLIPFVIILGVLLGARDSQKKRGLYIFLCSVVLIFVAAMRSPEWMTNTYNIDTLNYRDYFERAYSMDWDEMWIAMVLRYVGAESEVDIGFMLLQKLIGLVTHDFAVYSLLIDLFFFVPFGVILYRYCRSMKQLIFVYVFYISLVQVYLFGGARQIFAMGFDMMALLALIDKKRLRMIIYFLLGVSIHFSSILFAVPLLMIGLGVNARILKVMHAVSFVLFPIVLMIPNDIIVIMGNIAGIERYAEYGEGAIQGGAMTFIILIAMLSLFCYVAIRKKDIIMDKQIYVFYVMAPLFTLFAPLIHANGSMTRIALYYYIFLSLLVPYAIDCAFMKKNNTIVYAAAIGVLSTWTILGGGLDYYFFWQV